MEGQVGRTTEKNQYGFLHLPFFALSKEMTGFNSILKFNDTLNSEKGLEKSICILIIRKTWDNKKMEFLIINTIIVWYTLYDIL